MWWADTDCYSLHWGWWLHIITIICWMRNLMIESKEEKWQDGAIFLEMLMTQWQRCEINSNTRHFTHKIQNKGLTGCVREQSGNSACPSGKKPTPMGLEERPFPPLDDHNYLPSISLLWLLSYYTQASFKSANQDVRFKHSSRHSDLQSRETS